MDIENIALDFIKLYKRYKDKNLKAAIRHERKEVHRKEQQGVDGKTGKN